MAAVRVLAKTRLPEKIPRRWRVLSMSLCFSCLSEAADCCRGSGSYRLVWEPQTVVDVAAVSGRGVDGMSFLIVVFFVCHTAALTFRLWAPPLLPSRSCRPVQRQQELQASTGGVDCHGRHHSKQQRRRQ